jgi:hypothetical protein
MAERSADQQAGDRAAIRLTRQQIPRRGVDNNARLQESVIELLRFE